MLFATHDRGLVDQLEKHRQHLHFPPVPQAGFLKLVSLKAKAGKTLFRLEQFWKGFGLFLQGHGRSLHVKVQKGFMVTGYCP